MPFLNNILQNQIKIWKSQEEMKLIRKPTEQKVRQVHGCNYVTCIYKFKHKSQKTV